MKADERELMEEGGREEKLLHSFSSLDFTIVVGVVIVDDTPPFLLIILLCLLDMAILLHNKCMYVCFSVEEA